MIIDLKDNPKEFRQAVRTFFAETVPADWAAAADRGSEEEHVALQRWWMQELAKEGLAIPHWPAAYGGADLDLPGQIIIADEMARAATPSLDIYIVALNHIPGTLIPFGTEEQKSRYLPEVPQGTVWCQGFSEPSAGSDLAALRCRAERDGDHYVVNGQKIWSSVSRYAKRCILLVRTDASGPKQAGITFLLMDMDTPGLEVRPIEQIEGSAEFSELFLTDVRIPVENLVGQENDGWKVAQATLASERGVIAFDYAERRRHRVARFYREELLRKAEWLDDPEMRRIFVSILAEMQAGRRMILQLLQRNEHGHDPQAGIFAAYIKLFETTLMQRLGDFMTRIIGLDGQRLTYVRSREYFSGMYDFLYSYGSTISGGSNEIMRNIIAERGLALPREPKYK